ncbi:hypothetical protein [Brevibacterium aurantiacum]|nr:hypothetical protein [Brevibacterium aurantiacum]
MHSDSPSRREAGAPDDDPHPLRLDLITYSDLLTANGGDRH